MTATFVLNNQLRFQGSAMYAMVGVISGAVLNIALDPLFIFTFRLGVSGAAIATIISQFISFAFCFMLPQGAGISASAGGISHRNGPFTGRSCAAACLLSGGRDWRAWQRCA